MYRRRRFDHEFDDGFAQIEGDNDFCSWVWEARSVGVLIFALNYRPGSRPWIWISESAKKRVFSAAIYQLLKVNWLKTNINYYLNFEIFEQLMEMVSEVEKRAPEILPLTMDGLLH